MATQAVEPPTEVGRCIDRLQALADQFTDTSIADILQHFEAHPNLFCLFTLKQVRDYPSNIGTTRLTGALVTRALHALLVYTRGEFIRHPCHRNPFPEPIEYPTAIIPHYRIQACAECILHETERYCPASLEYQRINSDFRMAFSSEATLKIEETFDAMRGQEETYDTRALELLRVRQPPLTNGNSIRHTPQNSRNEDSARQMMEDDEE